MHSYHYNRDTGNFEVVFRNSASHGCTTGAAFVVRPFPREQDAAAYANYLNGGDGAAWSISV